MSYSFRVFGIPVRVGPAIFVGLLFLGLASRLSGAYLLDWVVLGLVALLLHELGHAIAFRRYGVHSTINFFLLGGMTVPDDTGSAVELSDANAVVVSLAGPGVSLAVGFASLAAVLAARQLGMDLAPNARVPASLWLFVNLGWGIFNLFPIASLDGGQALRHLLAAIVPGRAGVILGLSANLIGSAAIAFGAFWIGQPYLAFIAILFGLASPSIYIELLDAIAPSRLRRRRDRASASTPNRFLDPDELRAGHPGAVGDPRYRP